MELDYQYLVVTMVSALGLATLLKSLLSFVRWVWAMFLRRPKNLKEHYGPWALVTGPTEGIGRAVALELAAKGLNLVLVGRNPARLAEVAGSVARLGVQVRTVVVDLAEREGSAIREAVERATEGLGVGVVVNNAGLAYPYAQFFDEVGMDLVVDIVRVNVEAATWVTMAVLPRMLERKRGVVVNVGSAAADIFPSFPLYAVYAASKAYISVFSKCLSVEYRKSGIDFQCQVPIAVATKMTRVKAHSVLVVSPEMYAKASVRSIGFETLCAPYWSHSAQWFAISFLPDWLVNRCVYAYFVWINKKVKLKESRKKKIDDPKHT